VFRQCRELNESIIILDQHPSQISTFALGNTYTTIVMNLKHKKDVDSVKKFLLLEDKENEFPIRLGLGQAIVKLQDRIQDAFLIKVPEFPIKKGIITDEFIRKRIEKPRTSYQVTEKEKLFLTDVINFPNSNVVQRYERLFLGARDGTEIKDSLLFKGLIEQNDLITPSGRIKQLRLTELGSNELKGNEENTSQ
jgi:DNA helicase HerA-like ATPase